MPTAVTENRVQYLRVMLLRIIGVAQRDIRIIRDGMRVGGTDRRAVGDVTDDITMESDVGAIAARLTVLSEKLALAQDALRRLEAGDESYGTCDHCGQPIAQARLTALPFARRCVICQELAEARAPLTRRQTGARFTP